MNPGSNRVAVIFELSRLSLVYTRAKPRNGPAVFTRHGPLHLWNLFGITRFLRALSPCSTTISRGSDYLPSTSHCWQTLETEEIDGNCSKFGPILQIHEVNNSRLYRFFDADGKSCLRSQRSKSN